MSSVLKTAVAVVLVAGFGADSFAQEVTYKKNIRPLMQEKCVGCHGPNAPDLNEFLENEKKYKEQMKGPKMDTYADILLLVGWPDTGAIMRRLDDGKSANDGKPGNMYQYLGGTEEERQKNLNLFKAWIGPEAWTLKRWKARGNIAAVTKEELDKIRVKY